MAIRFQCPICSSIRAVHDRMRGKQIRCPDCDSVVRIPDAIQEEGLAKVVPLEPIQVPSIPVIGAKLTQRGDFELSEVSAATARQRKKDNPNPSKPAVAQSDAKDEEEEVESLAFAKRELPTDDMDMTPMVDVTFLLLIFFMITASFSTEKAIQQKAAMSNQASSQQKDEESDTVKILVDEFNAYTIIFPDGDEREATSKQELLAVLAMAELEGASEDASTLVIEAHEDSVHATVVGALDAGREKGFSQFQVTVVENFD